MTDDPIRDEAGITRLFAASALMVLQQFDNMELAAFFNAMHGFGWIAPDNMAYARAVEGRLVDANGNPWDREAVTAAAAREVSRRVEGGSFV